MPRDADVQSDDRQWTMIDAFVVERLHLRVRGPMEHIKNTATLEQSILAAVMTDQVRRLADRKHNSGLVGKVRVEGNIAYARDMYILSLHISVSDFVRNGNQCGEVCACAVDLTDGMHYVVVEKMDFISHLTPHSNRWRKAASYEQWDALRCDVAAAWYNDGDDVIVVQI